MLNIFPVVQNAEFAYLQMTYPSKGLTPHYTVEQKASLAAICCGLMTF